MRHVRSGKNTLRRNFAYFSLWHREYGRWGSKKAYTGPRTGIYLQTKFGCDRSIVVGCRSRNDWQTNRRNDNKAHSLQTWRKNANCWQEFVHKRCSKCPQFAQTRAFFDVGAATSSSQMTWKLDPREATQGELPASVTSGWAELSY